MADLPHAVLTLDTTKCTRTFGAKGAADLKVRSQIIPGGVARMSVRYHVTITRTIASAESLPYGLYNLCIQGRAWKVQVLSVRGKGIVFTRPSTNATGVKTRGPFDTDHQPSSKQRTLRRVQAPKTTPIINDRLWLLNFEGDVCELEIESFRRLNEWGPATLADEEPALEVLGEHDWSPPPPEGGGEEGEEEAEDEEEEDGEEEDGGEGE
jgi:hypothetical protein